MMTVGERGRWLTQETRIHLAVVVEDQQQLAAVQLRGDRGRHELYIEDEERLEMTSRTTDAIPNTPLHLTEFDGSYIRDFDGEMLMRAPNDSR
jgi:hypothetical protein